jgi:hypothetical protein
MKPLKSLLKFTLSLGGCLLLSTGLVFGQTTAYGTNDPGVQKRMSNQEQRIDQGIQSGSLTPREAGRLEGEQAKIQQTEERMKSDGQLTPQERQRLTNMQNRASSDIYRQKHDAQTANVGAGSTSSNVNDPRIQKRMQNQEQRINQGVQSGSLTPKEAGRLDAQQARIKQEEERMKSDGNLSPQEREHLTNMQNRASGNVYRQKHDAQTAPVK